MISLETTSDIQLLKELIETLTEKKGVDQNVISDMQERILSIEELQLKNLKSIVSLSKKVEEISSILKDKETIHVPEICVPDKEKEEPEKKKKAPIKRHRAKEGDPFVPHKNSQVKYQKISLDDINIVHSFLNRGAYRDSLLPINIFELLAIIERFSKNGDYLTVKEAKSFCKVFKMTTPQFSKIYYNLTQGSFNGVIAEMDKMIGESMFTYEKRHIYRNDHDTGVDIKEFKELVSIYANDSYPLCAACKLIHERNDINPFDLFTILRKSKVISKILEV